MKINNQQLITQIGQQRMEAQPRVVEQGMGQGRRYIRLGFLVVGVSDAGYQDLRDYVGNVGGIVREEMRKQVGLQGMRNMGNKQDGGSRKQQKDRYKKHFTRIFNHQYKFRIQRNTYYEQMYLVICFPSQKQKQVSSGVTGQQNQRVRPNTKQEQNILMQIKLQHLQIKTQLLNLTYKKWLKIDNPNIIVFQDETNISIQVYASQQFLIRCTNNYNKFEESIKPIQGFANQYQKITDRVRMAYQNKSSGQVDIISIIKYLVKQEDVNLGSQQIQEIKAKRIYNIINCVKNQNYQNSYHVQLQKLYKNQLSRKKKQNQQKGESGQKNSGLMTEMLSINFLNQSEKPSQYFDLSHDLNLKDFKIRGFEGQLKDYQKKALYWMLVRQGKNYDIKKDMSDTPFWWNAGQDLGTQQDLYVNSMMQYVVWGRKIIKKCRGGILADQMGLGKTVMVISLILAHRPQNDCKTLIICPLSLVKQWQQQINKFAPFLTVHIVNEQKLNERIVNQSDVVITTQGKIRGQNNSKKRKQAKQIRQGKQGDNSYSQLLDYKWFRIVIDQAHIFKNSKGSMIKNLCQLNASYRWCLTGTPVQNSVQDLFSILKFLKYSPWCFQEQWQGKAQLNNYRVFQFSQLIKVKNILKGIMLRRKKESVDFEGKKLLSLPNAQTNIHFVKMSSEARVGYQRFNYNALQTAEKMQNIQQKIKKYKGLQGLVKSLRQAKRYKHQMVWALMNKMRMICCHQFLINYKKDYIRRETFIIQYQKFLKKNSIIPRNKGQQDNFFDTFISNSQHMKLFHKQTQKLVLRNKEWEDTVRQITLGKTFPCLMCQGLIQQVITPCLHVFCKHCIQGHVFNKWQTHIMVGRLEKQDLGNQKFKKIKLKQFNAQCPHCNQIIKLNQLFDMPRMNEFNRPMEQFKYNQKMIGLLKHLKNLKQNDQGLIFTSFLGMMTLLSKMFVMQKIPFLHIQGNDSLEDRQNKIMLFRENPGIKVLIFTLKTGSVGLNMQVANKIYFMDPWWNPSVQQQAIGRVHRIGQKNEIQAIKFITQQTIQVRILKRCISKKQISDMVLDIDDIENNKKYSANHSQIRFLLSMGQNIIQSQKQQMQQDKQEQKQKIQDQEIEKSIKQEKMQLKVQPVQQKLFQNLRFQIQGLREYFKNNKFQFDLKSIFGSKKDK